MTLLKGKTILFIALIEVLFVGCKSDTAYIDQFERD